MNTVYGLELGELPDGWTPLEAVVMVKVLVPVEDGGASTRVCLRATDGLTMHEVVGMTVMASDDARQQAQDDWGEG